VAAHAAGGHSVVEFLLCALLGITTWAAVQFLLRYAGVRLRRVDVLRCPCSWRR
jgi:hypothetical protein